MKRAFDLMVALVGLILLAPVMMMAAILVLMDVGPPVLFRQTRPGIAGRPFVLFKFRTMRSGSRADGTPLPDDQRLTRIGAFLRRFSIDELPQLFNVVRGDMSIVGPRPLLMEYLPLYNARQARRHEVRPGLTGWAQVNGRNALSWEEKFELDVWYVDHRSFRLDLAIIWRTALRLLRPTGISQEGHATMPKFTGTRPDEEHRA